MLLFPLGEEEREKAPPACSLASQLVFAGQRFTWLPALSKLPYALDSELLFTKPKARGFRELLCLYMSMPSDNSVHCPALRVRHLLTREMSFVVFLALAALCCRYGILYKKKKKNQCFAVLSNLVSLKMHYLLGMLVNSLEAMEFCLVV